MPTDNRTGQAAVMNPALRGIEADSGPEHSHNFNPDERFLPVYQFAA